ncbi:CBS domain-containing protein [Neorhizobium galegae]|uniref:CBS domain-containing protein n=1 Tax=Neorhizobium galegae TaxID=399 RepID=UPI000621D85B|nr:CBS domain-containing protein [Neorhizobium galegae]CDZ27296.1 Putative signal-transduction protein containing cAMP-binding and CBS domains [Neorhizobium galegae bv. officinalis]KAA9387348.1 CBS domain-containing protein [Neorhizobium galegae]KAB1114493.1 CBS domain-containing protein [Neorhizobium galegae]MCM2496945.1 CBS domain-containing protein [Neorhizobium galegae]MCQ1765241.1 CBS domain-containing protein [Neorhizobium galegae]
MAIIVKNMLDAKGRDVVTVGPDKTLLEVAGILNDKKIGAVVVTGMEGRIAGIFTERDLVRAVAGKGAAVLDQPVKSAMTTSVQRCKDETTVDELMGMMSSGRFRHVPVEQDGKLAGIISIGDVVKSRIREIELEAEQIKAYIAG